MEYKVFAIEFERSVNLNCLPMMHKIGVAGTKEEAVRLCRTEGWEPFLDGEYGSVEQYDADAAPRVYGYEPDGMGAISVTVNS